jgi:hypothetical protein
MTMSTFHAGECAHATEGVELAIWGQQNLNRLFSTFCGRSCGSARAVITDDVDRPAAERVVGERGANAATPFEPFCFLSLPA